MEQLLLSSSASAAASSSLDLHSRHRYTPAAAMVDSLSSQSPSSGSAAMLGHGAAGGVQREKRNGDPVSARDYLNPRKRARSTSPPPATVQDSSLPSGAIEATDRVWVAAKSTTAPSASRSGRPVVGDKPPSGAASVPVDYLGDDEGEESSESEEEEEEEEEELPPGDRVAYIHVGEGGEADLEAQLKGNGGPFVLSYICYHNSDARLGMKSL
jgi:hypothetical protein